MKDRLRYRVWCKNKNEWEKDEVCLSSNGYLWQRYGNGLVPLSPETHIIQFCTGLEDKNGVLIFEGDIVKWGHLKGSKENPIRIADVRINPDIQFNSNLGIFKYGNFIYSDTENHLEIIGNIHDNPELMEG